MTTEPSRGHTVRELAKILRVSPDKIRAWIKRGELPAINTSSARCRRPRYIILPHHLREFEQHRRAGPTEKPARKKRSRCPVDYYPD